jgi:hypothetical protein
MNIPAMAATMPTRKVRVTRCRQSTQPASVTKMGARLASSVELATDVYMIDQCHTPRSHAKKMPAPASGPTDMRTGVGSARSAQIHSSGAASAVRQKALATGPASRGARRWARRRSRSRRQQARKAAFDGVGRARPGRSPAFSCGAGPGA